MPQIEVKKDSRKHAGVALLIAITLCFAASGIGGLFTASSVSTWYLDLQRPSWTPPGWIFGPVWASLYLSMAIAVWLVWRKAQNADRAIVFFALQLALNIAWSAIFFGARNPGWALVEIIVLIMAISATIYQFAKVHRPAALIMLPYLAWVGFATVLNASIWWLNRAN